MRNRPKRGLHFLIFLAVCAGISAIVMLLWNALIPAIIGWGVINYWQALGLMVLCRLLLGGFGNMNKWGFASHAHRHLNEMHGHMHKMSPAERREFIRRRMMCCDDTPEQTDKDNACQ
jgi:hypothetical protein